MTSKKAYSGFYVYMPTIGPYLGPCYIQDFRGFTWMDILSEKSVDSID